MTDTAPHAPSGYGDLAARARDDRRELVSVKRADGTPPYV